MKYHIVSIGISRHQNPSANLDFAAKDATEFFELFGMNLPDQGYKKILIDSEATLGQIRSAIGTELKESMSPEDAFFFFYSGHGAVAGSKNDSNIALNYLVPFDATFDFENSCISIEYLKQVFEDLPTKSNFIFIDSCFSGAITKNTKGYPVPKTKVFKSVKSFTNTEIGNGTLIFTACKDDQESIEDPEYKNGLFTYELFSELQMKREGDQYDALAIFSPIAGRVEKRAFERWSHPQTPTFSGKIQGIMTFPVFKKKLKVTPELISVPHYTELTDASFPTAYIELPNNTKEGIINDTISLVLRSKKDNELGDVTYERYCSKLLRDLKNEWEKIFIENGSAVEEIPNTIAKLEGASFQFVLLGGVTSVFGSDTQMNIYSKYAVSILEWAKDKSGLVALIAVPEVVLLNIVYLIGILSLATEKFKPLEILMNTKIDDIRGQDLPPYKLIQYNHLFFCTALSGYSNKVHDHVREVLAGFDWLTELVPSIEGKIENLQHQTSLLFCVWIMLKGERMWPDFARFDSGRVFPLVKKIKYEEEFQKKIAVLLGIEPSLVRDGFIKSIVEYRRNGLGGNYFWHSINENDFLTKEEREKKPI